MGYWSFFENFIQIACMFLARALVLLAFFILAIQLFVTLIEFKLTTLAGFVLIPFGLFGKSAFMAERVLGNVISSGIKVLVLAVIIGIGSTLFSEFTSGFGGATPTIDEAMAIVLAALSLLGLGIFGPGMASGIVAGGPQLSAGAAVGTGLAAGGMVAAGAGLVGAAASGGAALAGGVAAASRGGAAVAGGASTAYSLGAASQSGAAGVASGLGGVARAGGSAAVSPPRRVACRREHALQLQCWRQGRIRSHGRLIHHGLDRWRCRRRRRRVRKRRRPAGLGAADAALPTHDPCRPGHGPRRPLWRRSWRRLFRQSVRRRSLMLKRPSTHYSKAREPETPYQRAAQIWDERIGAARVQARNWRLMAFGSLILSAGFATALIVQSARGTIVPWVVQVDRLGQAQAVAPAEADYRPTDPQIAFHLARFIEQVRSIPADAIIVRQNWLRAYDFTTDRGAMALNDYARSNDPFTRVGRQQVAVDVSSVIRASPDSFRVAWVERRYENGQLAETTRWTAILMIVVQVPRNADRLRANPLGIYVNAINWSRELGQ